MLNAIYQSLDPVAITLGPFAIRWYGIAYVLGFVLCGVMMYRTARKWRIDFDEDSLMTVILCVVVGVILGARLGYVLVYGEADYLANPLEIMAFNHGGMSFHGGLVGALVAGVVASVITKVPFLTLADMGAMAAPIGLFFGRCANFINGELWGAVTDLPWGVVFGGSAGMMPRHPSQLYEALLEGLLLFAILMILRNRKPPCPRGTFLGTFLVGYGICRFALEFIRQPDAQLGYLWGGWLTMGQVLSVPLILAGVALLAYALVKRRPQQGIRKGSK
ncbi:MAG: prolipoprotein diacylglyceryl transferase [Coriobacteriia bacterium]|nr:prolipoprotein diacylglyceryl transferase [Coriobacteriia bacterium]